MWNPFKTKKQFVGVKLFIEQDIDEKHKWMISDAFFDYLKRLMPFIDRDSFEVFENIKHPDIVCDDATVIYAKFFKSKNYYGDNHFTKKYLDIFKIAWEAAEIECFSWERYDVRIYPVVK